MSKHLFSIPFVAILAFSCSQSQKISQTDISKYQKAFKEISEIKEGGVAIRMRSNTKALLVLDSVGNKDGAKNLREQQSLVNSKIEEAISKYFTFSPLYTFQADQTLALKEGNSSILKPINNGSKAVNPARFIVNPYDIENKNTNGMIRGFSLEKISGENVSPLITRYVTRREGLGIRTYEQMAFDWNLIMDTEYQWLKSVNDQLERGNPMYAKDINNLRKNLLNEKTRAMRSSRPLKPREKSPVLHN